MQTTAHAMTSYSDEIYDGQPTNIFVTQYMIKLIDSQIVSASIPLLEVSSGLEFYYLQTFLLLNTWSNW